jgi:hypothetical protein
MDATRLDRTGAAIQLECGPRGRQGRRGPWGASDRASDRRVALAHALPVMIRHSSMFTLLLSGSSILLLI